MRACVVKSRGTKRHEEDGMGRLITAILLSLGATLGSAVAEGRFDGMYRPAGDTYSPQQCDIEWINSDGGPLVIKGGKLHGVESVCEMTNPVNVRDMDAVLFDMECWAEGSPFNYRAMLLRRGDTNLHVITDRWVWEWTAC